MCTNVTKFHEIHPGGNLIKQAAGADVSVFWDYWGHHHHAPSVGKYLEKLRIGSLKKEDQIDGDIMGEDKKDDPYAAEPPRERSLQTIFAERPFCSETPKMSSRKKVISPPLMHSMYVIMHLCQIVPGFLKGSETAYSNNYEVTFEARCNNEDGASASMTIGELKARYGTETVTSILQCAGNRASEDIAATGPNGFTGTVFETITLGMVGNGEWTGIPLCDILPATLFPVECKAALDGGGEEYHVVFEGADGYSSSTSIGEGAEEAERLFAGDQNEWETIEP